MRVGDERVDDSWPVEELHRDLRREDEAVVDVGVHVIRRELSVMSCIRPRKRRLEARIRQQPQVEGLQRNGDRSAELAQLRVREEDRVK